MSLYNCPECSSPVSQYAESCPHCGFPLKEYKDWISHERSYGYDRFENAEKQAVGVKVIINCEDRYPIEYEGVFLPEHRYIYAYNKVNENVIVGAVIPGVGVYLARVEEKSTFPLLYAATDMADGRNQWYYGCYGIAEHPDNNDGMCCFDLAYDMKNCVVRVSYNCSSNPHGSEMTDLLDVIRKGYNLNACILRAMEQSIGSYHNYLREVRDENYNYDLDEYRCLDK